jgi:hypothetical protein
MEPIRESKVITERARQPLQNPQRMDQSYPPGYNSLQAPVTSPVRAPWFPKNAIVDNQNRFVSREEYPQLNSYQPHPEDELQTEQMEDDVPEEEVHSNPAREENKIWKKCKLQ